MTDWTVQPEMHHLLTVNLPVTPDRMPLRKGRHLRKADWKAFTRLVNTAYEAYSSPVLWSVQEIDRATSHLHTAITAALDEIAPIVPYHPKKSVFSWWNADLEDLKKASCRAHDFARRQPHLDDRWQAYRASQTELKNACLKAR
jgi:hypothetical protein